MRMALAFAPRTKIATKKLASTGIEYRPFSCCSVPMMLFAFWYSGTSASEASMKTTCTTWPTRLPSAFGFTIGRWMSTVYSAAAEFRPAL